MNGLLEFAERSLGIDLYPGQREVLSGWITSGKRKAVFALGRRSGKNLMAAVTAIYNATMLDYSGYLRPGEARFIVIVATRQEQARESIRVIREVLEHAPDPDLAMMVDPQATTLDEIQFANGVVIRAMPCSARSTRGLPISLLILDEAAHMSTAEAGFAAGKEVYQALQPSTAQFGDRGYTLLISSPNWRSGVFWDLYKAAVEGVADDTYVVQRPTWEVNPRITRESLEAEFRADPDRAAREYAAQFSVAAGAYLDPIDVLGCVRKGSRVLPPGDGSYVAAIDPAFARDAFALGIAHREDDRIIVDGVWTWHRNGFERTLDEVLEVARKYGVRTVRTDQFSAQAVLEGLQRRGLGCDAIAWDNAGKYQAFSQLKAALNTRTIELPDDDGLTGELLNLEARSTASGLTRIADLGSGHDDRAVVLAALMDTLAGGRRGVAIFDLDGGGYTADGRAFTWDGDRMVYADADPWEKPKPPPTSWDGYSLGAA